MSSSFSPPPSPTPKLWRINIIPCTQNNNICLHLKEKKNLSVTFAFKFFCCCVHEFYFPAMYIMFVKKRGNKTRKPLNLLWCENFPLSWNRSKLQFILTVPNNWKFFLHETVNIHCLCSYLFGVTPCARFLETPGGKRWKFSHIYFCAQIISSFAC